MTLTSGFFNATAGDRAYSATDMGRMFDGLILDGVFLGVGNALFVRQTDVASMNVVVSPGRAWFNHTWTLNDADLTLAIAAAHASYWRYDAVVLEVNESTNVRANTIKVLTGTPSPAPVYPTLTETSTIHQYVLAYVTIPALMTEITSDYISTRIGTPLCPYVTGVVKTSIIGDLIPDQTVLQKQLASNASKITNIQAASIADWSLFSSNNIDISLLGARMQAGSARLAANGSLAVTFPTPFTGVPIVIASVGPISGITEGRAVSIRLVSNTGFTAAGAGGSTYGDTFMWLAIGPTDFPPD